MHTNTTGRARERLRTFLEKHSLIEEIWAKNTRRKYCRWVSFFSFSINRGRRKIYYHINIRLSLTLHWLMSLFDSVLEKTVKSWNTYMEVVYSHAKNRNLFFALKSYSVKYILHWLTVHLFDEFHHVYKMLDRKMMLTAEIDNYKISNYAVELNYWMWCSMRY